MSIVDVSLMMTGGLILVLATGIPVWLALLTVGLGAFALQGSEATQFIGGIPWSSTYSFTLLALPLFVLMGYLMQTSGIVDRIFRFFHSWLFFLPGALGWPIMLTCMIFAATSGSATAAVAVISKVSYPIGKKYGYSDRFLAGLFNGGASLATLIPPSIAFIIYGSLTGTSISDLFIAGIVPGIVVTVMMLAYVVLRGVLDPKAAPRLESATWDDRIRSAKVVPAVGAVIVLVLGGIYLGWYTPTEAAAVGCGLGFLLVVGYQGLRWNLLARATWNAAVTSSYILILLMASFMFGHVLEVLNVHQALSAFIQQVQPTKLQMIIFMSILYFIMGMFVNGGTMQVITIPVVAPLLPTLGIDMVWFGVLVAIFTEVATCSPPVGLDYFVIQRVTGISYEDNVIGGMPMLFIWSALVVVIIVFPDLALWLPATMGERR